MFVNYNDYELIYLIREGEYSAFRVLFKKYECLIEIKVHSRYPYGDKAYDLIQEGRMVLNTCIKNYSFDVGVNFYAYFNAALSRKLFKELCLDYYKPSFPFKESIDDRNKLPNAVYIPLYKKHYKNDRIAMILLTDYFCGSMSLLNISEKYNIHYIKLVRKRDGILAYLKKYIDYL